MELEKLLECRIEELKNMLNDKDVTVTARAILWIRIDEVEKILNNLKVG